MKAILAAAALAIAASAVPAAAYEGEHRQYKPSYNTSTQYNKYDNDRRDTRTTRVDRDDRYERREQHSDRGFWWRRHHRDNDYVEVRPHHRRHWWSYWD
jgi:hypothetical protein